MLAGLRAKLSALFAFIVGTLVLLLRSEKSKRKAAEQEAGIEKSNRQLLEKEKVIITDLDKVRATRDKSAEERHLKQIKKIERLKNENDDSVVIGDITILLGKTNRPD